MSVRKLGVLAGVGAPLILTALTPGGFTGISTTSKPNEFGLFVVNVYAEFDRPGEDFMSAVAGTGNAPMNIFVVGGTFYNNPIGNDYAPSPALIEVFPSLAYDTFYTIGKKDSTGDQLVISAGMNHPDGSAIQTEVAGWYVPPDAPQANPFDPVNSFPGDGRVLIGQFSTLDGTGIEGTMLLQYTSNNVFGQSVVSFQHMVAPPCPWDMDGTTYVGIEDFLTLLANWGTDPGGPPDFDGDGTVDINDFLELLAHWGPCP